MLIGATFLLAILLTALLTLLLHYCSQKKLLSPHYSSFSTPTGIGLTFLNSFLFSAILAMMLHASAINLNIFRPALARNTLSESVGIFPENAVVIPSPITTFQPYGRTPEPTTLLTQVLNQAEGEETVAPVSTPPPSTAPAPTPDGQLIESEPAVYVLSINGEIKGYTTAYLHNLTILKDLIADSRVMVTVKSGYVKFLNLETGRLLNANVIAPAEWEKFHPDEELADWETENHNVYPTDLTPLTF